MKKNIMRKNLRQSIKKSLGRYLAIVSIIALGAGLFVGLLSSKMDMVATAQNFMDSQNMFDLSLMNTYGWNRGQVDEIRNLEGVEAAQGSVILDVIGTIGESQREGEYQLYSMPRDINKVLLLGGRMPSAPNECLMDGFHGNDQMLNTTFQVSSDNESGTLESLKYTSFTIVGYVSTPLFMDMTRSNTTLGDGSIDSYIYLPEEAFDVDYYTRIDIKIPGEHKVYTEAFTESMDAAAEQLRPQLEELAENRYQQILSDGWEAYNEGYRDYEEGVREFESGRSEALQGLNDAKAELEGAEQTIAENEQKITDGEKQLASGRQEIAQNQASLSAAQQELDQAKGNAYKKMAEGESALQENQKTVESNLESVNNALMQVESGLTQLDSGITQLEMVLEPINIGIETAEIMISDTDEGIARAQEALDKIKESEVVDPEIVQQLQGELDRLKEKRDVYVAQFEKLKEQAQRYNTMLQELKAQREDLITKKNELQSAKTALQAAQSEIQQGFEKLNTQKAQAEAEFASAQEKITSGKQQLQNATALLNQKAQELEAGRQALADGKIELSTGWEEYHQAEADVKKELKEAEQKLIDGKQELENAKNKLEEMKSPSVYALTRDTNVGYQAVSSNSDIVAGVSRVFPAFFLLVAALVCITTMTRMVEEERTQIGTLKALGYSNGAIAGKYLIYAGSASVVGCGLGVLIGSIVFPKIIWVAYSIILKLKPRLDITFNVPLCIIVVTVTTLLMLLVTWSSCRFALRQVPAELVRPKAPAAGKKILLEYIPLWRHLPFLDKVMLRNIFRYRKRLLMMLVGICGCTALLVTGFGIGDSIKDIVSYQFEEVTLYDMQVQFSEGLTDTQQEAVRQKIGDRVQGMAFAHQSSIDMEFNGKSHSANFVTGGEDIANFYSFHSEDQQLALPPPGQAMVSIGIADKLGLSVGDRVTLRNGDMETLDVTVSAIFDNNVFNYAIVAPETVVQQLGREPEYQIAYANAAEGFDPQMVGAEFSSMDNVMNVMVSQALADQVGSMLQAMDLIVLTVVICAGMLAVIVLYNLTNINITEREREIATIRVLGFNSWETALYVFKENLILSLVGSGIGLFAGKLLLAFVMNQIKIDMVWFEARVLPGSLVLSIAITIFMALLVDFVLYFRLEKIDMAEALKSVE